MLAFMMLVVLPYNGLLLHLYRHFTSTSLIMWTHYAFISLVHFVLIPPYSALTVPQAFPTSGNGLWYTQPGKVWSKDLLPVGNGYLAGEPVIEDFFCQVLISFSSNDFWGNNSRDDS